MGRGKLSMELISDPKARCTTFQKRKKGLKKKTYELSTLCGVDICAIVYGPKLDDLHPIEPEIWPTDPNVVQNMISLYQNQDIEDRKKRTVDLSDFLEDRKKKVDDEIIKLRKKNYEAKYSTWDNRYNNFSEELLRELGAILDQKLEAAMSRLESMKGDKKMGSSSMMNSTYLESNPNCSYFMRNLIRSQSMQVGVIHDQKPIASMNPDAADVSFYHPFDPRANPMVNPNMVTMMMNGSDRTQLSGASSSNMMPAPLNRPVWYDDPTAGMLGNVIAGNRWPSMGYDYWPTMPPMPQYVSYPGISSAASSQVDQFYDVTVEKREY